MGGVNSLILIDLLWCVCLYWAAAPSVASASSQRNITLVSLGQEDTLFNISPYLGGNSSGNKSRHLCNPARVPDTHTSSCLFNATNIGPVRSQPQFKATVQRKTDSINNSTTILSTHHIELVQNLVGPTQLLECLTANDDHQSQPLILLNFVTCFSENSLVQLLDETQPDFPEGLFLYKTEQCHLTYNQDPTQVTKQQLSFLAEYDGPFFFPYPTPSDLYEAVLTFVHQMGWKRMTFIQQCTNPLAGSIVSHLKDWARFKRSETILFHSSHTAHQQREADSQEAGFETLPHEDAHSVNSSDEMHLANATSHVDLEGDVFTVLRDLDVLELSVNDNPQDVLQKVYQEERRIIVFSGQLCKYLDLLVEAHKKLLYGPGFVWIYVYQYLEFPEHYDLATLFQRHSVEDQQRLKEALPGTLAVGVTSGLGEQYQAFLNSLEKWQMEAEEGVFHPLQQTAYAWDTVDYVAKVLDRIVHMKALSLGLNLDDVTLTSNDTVTMWADAMVEVAIDGVTGLMAFSRTGIRTTSTYHIKNLVPIDADPDCYYNSSQGGDNTTFPWFVETRAMLTITTGPPLLQFLNSSGLPVNRSTLVFSGGNEAIPQDGPGRPYVRDPVQFYSFGMGYLALCLLIMVVYLWNIRRQDSRALLFDNSWIYRLEDIDFDRKRGFVELMQWSRKCLGSCDFSAMKVGKVNDQTVYLKKASLTQNSLTVPIREEILQIRELQHPNVCSFVGCVIDPTLSAILMEHCNRGSLLEVLTQDYIELVWAFRLTFAVDACRGLAFLHSKKILHGRLSSTNCVIDNRWTLKLTDFALTSIRNSKLDSSAESRKWTRKSQYQKQFKAATKVMFQSPEVRLLGSAPSAASDVYSLGIIMSELACHKSMVASRNEQQVITLIRASNFDSDVPYAYLQLSAECANTCPASRPTSEAVADRLTLLDPKQTRISNSNMLTLLENYSKNLEDVLEERTEWLKLEKKKNNTALYRFLPSLLATMVQEGKSLPPREFPSASVLVIELDLPVMADNEQDTSAALDLVNKVQKIFEEMSGTFAAHRVHHAGSAYTFVSGVHGNEECNHVIQLSQLALQVMLAIENLSEMDLGGAKDWPQVRVGLHTGPVTGGVVVQQQQPMYMVHGKTLEVAQLLALTAKVGSAHVSEAIMHQLDKQDGFVVDSSEERMMYVGKPLTSYWLAPAVNWMNNKSRSLTTQSSVTTATLQVPPPPTGIKRKMYSLPLQAQSLA